ncbi:LysR family transcriptional regulator [Vibrio sp. S4M6]|uniref:LysR family transcriptional regulator n=1 Tax=Vibrio sinus TaxID=2946865 RepID=UPI00202A84FD|nr:LysR family transcriptional regulator [Vibrio sinus]MCL9780097.1 LysR family transcriptional regulator [Vibrio sinus]
MTAKVGKTGFENININHIRYFVSVYELGSISKAAKDCNVSQPTISKSLKSLEKQFNVVLFNRDTRLFYPTDAAQQLYPKCLELCSSAKAICNVLDVINHGDFGEVKIGFGKIVGPLGSVLMSKIISDKYSDLRVSITEGNPSSLHRNLLQGNLDFFICHDDAKEILNSVDQLVCKPFIDVEVNAVVSPKATFLKTEDNMTMFPWAFPKLEVLATSKNNFYNDYYKEIVANGSVLYQIDNIDARLKLVLSGQAAMVSTSISTRKYVKSGILQKLPIEIDDIPLSVFHLSTKPLSNSAYQILDMMKSYFEMLKR